MAATATRIDCDIHPAVGGTRTTLLPYLDDHWKEQVVSRAIDGLDLTSYPPNMPLSGRADWRPAKGNFLARINREQLLAISRDVLGEQWSQARRNDKKSSLVDELDRAFAHSEKHRTPEQTAKLKSWLPQGMAFDIAPSSKPAKSKKTRKAA